MRGDRGERNTIMEFDLERARVAAGYAFLLSVDPDWSDTVDLDILDLDNPYRCVLGQWAKARQLTEGFYGGFWAALDTLGIEEDGDMVEAYGFAGGRRMTGIWKQMILEQRERDGKALSQQS
jgi:hypothetical protein